MANPNPKGDGGAVALTFPAAQARFLRVKIADCKAGVNGDLAQASGTPDAPRWRRESAAYGRLLAGLGGGEVVPDAEVRRVTRELAASIDAGNEHERAVFERAALCGLLAQLDGGAELMATASHLELAGALGEALGRLRRRSGLSQSELGRRARLHRTAVGLLERGKRVPRADTMIRLAAGLSVRPGALLDEVRWEPGNGHGESEGGGE